MKTREKREQLKTSPGFVGLMEPLPGAKWQTPQISDTQCNNHNTEHRKLRCCHLKNKRNYECHLEHLIRSYSLK